VPVQLSRMSGTGTEAICGNQLHQAQRVASSPRRSGAVAFRRAASVRQRSRDVRASPM